MGGTISAADRKAAADVSKLIDAIGTVSKDSGTAISAARKAYDALTDTQKGLVSNYTALMDAEAAYSRLTGTLPFQDIPSTAWCYDAVRYVYENKLFQGTSADTFSPNRTMTRAMLVTVLYRLSGAPKSNGTPDFTDVKQGDWCAEAVAWAASHGIVTGFADGRFAPNANITREQMAAILFRYAGYRGLDTTAGNGTSLQSYTDAAAIHSYAVPAMRWAIGSGLITGRTSTTLVPGSTATRAEVAVILYRFCQKTAN